MKESSQKKATLFRTAPGSFLAAVFCVFCAVFLIVDGRDAEFIKEELTKKYGDFVVFDSEKYTRGFFKDAAELCVGWWYEKPSRGYTG